MILVAFFPVRASKNMHLVGAVLGFGGLVIATLVSLLFFIVKIFTHYNKKMLSIGGFYFLPFVAVCILTFIYSGLPLLESFRRGIPFGDFTPDVWEIFEWGMLLSGLLTTIGILKLSTYQQSNKQQI